MKARLKDMQRGDRFWHCGVAYEVKKIIGKEIQIGGVSSGGARCSYGRNCMMWVEIIEQDPEPVTTYHTCENGKYLKTYKINGTAQTDKHAARMMSHVYINGK